MREEIRSPKFWKALRAELLSSLLLAVFVTGAAQRPPGLTGPSFTHTGQETSPAGRSGSPTEAPGAAAAEAAPAPAAAPTAAPATAEATAAAAAATAAAVSDGGDGARMALAYALTVATLVQCVGNMSGAHANPAVTLGLLVCRLVSPLRAAAYVTVQLAGGLVGALILYGLTPAGDGYRDQVSPALLTTGNR